MFVAVLTTPAALERRNSIRQMWRDASEGWGTVLAKFAICKGDGPDKSLVEEQNEHDDMLFLDCEEGYLNGMLTRKVATAMKAFLEDYADFDFFMKIDDDTFISTRRLCDLFAWRRDQGKDNHAAYFGVFAEGPHEAIDGVHEPIRDPESPWYEPLEKFSGEIYPISAKGGPGYILGRGLVRPIIEEGIAQDNELNNEDKAVGVWVDEIIERGQHVDIVNLPGTDGYDEHWESYVTSGPYKTYEVALHHHLSGARIACLHDVDMLRDAEAPIDHCFNDINL